MAAIASPVVVDTMTTPASAVGRSRLDSVDLLRGIVMVIMVLDHTRDFVHGPALRSDPTDLATTSAAIFMTRWITHFCAPVFVFLAGVSVYLQKMRGKSLGDLSRFLVTRSIWLIALELTVIRASTVSTWTDGRDRAHPSRVPQPSCGCSPISRDSFRCWGPPALSRGPNIRSFRGLA